MISSVWSYINKTYGMMRQNLGILRLSEYCYLIVLNLLSFYVCPVTNSYLSIFLAFRSKCQVNIFFDRIDLEMNIDCSAFSVFVFDDLEP